jgi:chorismate mutase
MRKQLNTIDRQLIQLLAKRFAVTEQVGLFKREHNLPAQDRAREEAIVTRLRSEAKEHKVDPDLIEQIIRAIMAQVVNRHKELQKEAVE